MFFSDEIISSTLENAKRRGQFNSEDPQRFLIEKIKEEADELLEAHDDQLTSDINSFNPSEEDFYSRFEKEIKGSEGDELADIILIAWMVAKEKGINLEKHIEMKAKYNSMRS